MTVFSKSATFPFTAFERGGALWKKQGREENGKEGGSRRNPKHTKSYQFSIINNFDRVQFFFVKI
ncbi:MAG: hypothetical protein II814_12640, partial [Treponema sp.]|nr:hypothetical protein [Treponema sp.]